MIQGATTTRTAHRSARPPATEPATEPPIALAVPAGVRLHVSDDDFSALCVVNTDLRLERTAQGDLIVMTPAGSETGGRNARLTSRLVVWADADGEGTAFDSSAGFRFPNGATRAPDASWIRNDRWNALAPEQKRRFAPICPDFAVELCSPSDERKTASAKMREYIDNGLRLGWLLDPDDGQVEIHRPGRPVEVLDRPATLSGEDVLPGFTLDLKGILFD
jgi:Uma2 family endonuclease